LISGQGELAHRTLKAFYPLTSKLDTPAQLAKHERRRRVLRRVAGHNLHTAEQPLDLPAGLKDHHYIPTLSRNNPLDLFSFLRNHDNDPAVTVSGTILMFTLLTYYPGVHSQTQGPHTVSSSQLRCRLLRPCFHRR
jgi:hypothetical protein